MAPLPRKALIAITSVAKPLHDDKPTGFFITEGLHPYLVLREAGFEVTLASETGKYTPDSLSLTEQFLNGKDKQIWEDTSSEFRRQLDAMPKASELDASQFGLFFASAGHAALYDFPTATFLQKIASDVYSRGGIFGTTCHGAAILPGVVDNSTGENISKGRLVTGFTREAEYTMDVMKFLNTWNRPLIDDWCEQLGAKYVRPADIWGDFVVKDGRLVSGANPQSARSAAYASVHAFDAL